MTYYHTDIFALTGLTFGNAYDRKVRVEAAKEKMSNLPGYLEYGSAEDLDRAAELMITLLDDVTTFVLDRFVDYNTKLPADKRDVLLTPLMMEFFDTCAHQFGAYAAPIAERASEKLAERLQTLPKDEQRAVMQKSLEGMKKSVRRLLGGR